MRTTWILCCVLGVTGGALAPPAWAEDGCAAFDRALVRVAARSPSTQAVRVGVGLYGWLADTEGTIWADGESQDLELDFADVLEKTEGGLQAHAEAWWRRWYLALDVTWADLGDEITSDSGLLTLDADVEQWIVDLRLGYRLWRRVLGPGPAAGGSRCERAASLHAYVGARYYRNDLDFEVAVGPLRRRITEVDESLDPLLGLRLGVDLSCRFSLDLQADIAALGIHWQQGEYSYEMAAHLAWHLTRRWSLLVGYRLQGQDRVEGSGAEKSGPDLVTHGPLVGALYRF